MTNMGDSANAQKEKGNEFFKNGKYPEALEAYTNAIKMKDTHANTAIYYKNRAACELKLEKYTEAAMDCTKSLDLAPNDPKALFRRCQAFEAMERYEDAYKDAMFLMRLDPKNKAVQPILMRLNPIIQERMKKQSSTTERVSQMFDLTFQGQEADEEKRRTAAQNLIVLAREPAGAEKIFRSGGVSNLINMMEREKDAELRLTATRVIACLCKDSKERSRSIYTDLTLKKLCVFLGVDNDEISTAAAHVLQNMIAAVTNLEQIRTERDEHNDKRQKNPNLRLRPYFYTYDQIDEEGAQFVDEVFPALIHVLNNHKVSKYGRDNAMELLIKYITKTDGVGWSAKLIDMGGLTILLEVAGTIPEHKSLKTTEHTRMHASLLLQKVYEDLVSDKERDKYREHVNAYFSDMFGDNIHESKLEAVMALAALLQGPYEVGNHILARDGIVELMLAMADSGNAIYTKYAVEALVHSASKKERCSGVIKQATPILKTLYQSQSDTIKVRALVGLCKLGSFGGRDASAKTFADGSNQTLSKACRKFLNNPSKDVDLRKWAAEGLAYLTLDADIKEELCTDTAALTSLFDLAKLKDKGTTYPVATILVNCANAYDKKEVEPELVELAKFAKHHVPEDHAKDTGNYVENRKRMLIEAGVTSALVTLTSTTSESENTRELLAKVFRACAEVEDKRGLMVQQGAAKALISLAMKHNTDHGKANAAQGLAKIAISTNPEIAFPGQRSAEVVRPLLQLLHPNCTSLMNYEALLALTNLASMSDAVRKQIVKENGLSSIEHYMYEEHEMLRPAATECMCNMVYNEEVAKRFEGENDLVKLMLLYSGDEEDARLVRASAGCLAILSHEEVICKKITTCSEQWQKILTQLAACDYPDLQHRGLFIIYNLMCASKDIAAQIVAGPMFEVLMALSKVLDDPSRKEVKDLAEKALDKAVEWELITPTDRPS